ncbi:hypothetical protein D3C85_1467060 [compost metagenome]
MAVHWLEAQRRIAPHRPVMTCVVLALVLPATTDARKLRVTGSHPGVECMLGIFKVLCPALQLLLADFDFAAVALVDGLLRLLLIPGCVLERAGWAANCLTHARRDE